MGKRVLVTEPWIGEVGLFVVWLAGVRYAAKHGDYGHVIVIGPAGFDYLAADFADEYIAQPFTGIVACGAYGKQGTQPARDSIDDVVRAAVGGDVDCDVYPAVETHIVGTHPGNRFRDPMGDRAEFVRYGEQDSRWTGGIAVHARWRMEWGDDRNWSQDNWAQWAGMFRQTRPDVPIFCIGSTAGSLMLPGALDYRGMPIAELCDLLASVECVVGPSSGPMHLASLCGCPQVVWIGEVGLKQEILVARYMAPYPDGWNPHGADVACIIDEHWNPSPAVVAGAVDDMLNHLGAVALPASAPAQGAAAAQVSEHRRLPSVGGDRAASCEAPPAPIAPPVGIGVICYRNADDVETCVNALARHTVMPQGVPLGSVVTLLDNSGLAGSGFNDGVHGYWREAFPGATYLRPRDQYGCWRGRNMLWAHAEAMGYAAFVVIDADVQVTAPNWLPRMIAVMNEHPDCAVVGWRLANILGKPTGPNGEIDEMPGMCCLYRTAAVADVGGWDRDFHPFHSGDTDFCLRVGTVAQHPRFASRRWTCRLVPGESAIIHPEPHKGVKSNPDHAAIVQRSMDTLARKTTAYRAAGIDYPIMANIAATILTEQP